MLLKRGFTLVEMLFVVIIAATALALALPSYKSMRERGKFQAASGMLIDLGSAVESITRDLVMQGESASSVNVSSSYVEVNNANMTLDSTGRKTVKQMFDGLSGTASAKVLKLLVPAGYLKNFVGQAGFKYYVGGGTGSKCGGDNVVACMIKPSPANNDCFAGARYYKGGRFETIRMANCKNN